MWGDGGPRHREEYTSLYGQRLTPSTPGLALGSGSTAAFLLLFPLKEVTPRAATLSRGNDVLGGFWEVSELPGAPRMGRAAGLASLSLPQSKQHAGKTRGERLDQNEHLPSSAGR